MTTTDPTLSPGSDFRLARLAAGLSYRRAAEVLGVSVSTIQRWEANGPPPGVTYDTPPADTAYTVGRLLALAERAHGHRLPLTMYQPDGGPAAIIAATARYIAPDADCRRLAAEISRSLDPANLLADWSPEDESRVWLGYYHQIAASGQDEPQEAQA